jgi:hypothetical protein
VNSSTAQACSGVNWRWVICSTRSSMLNRIRWTRRSSVRLQDRAQSHRLIVADQKWVWGTWNARPRNPWI